MVAERSKVDVQGIIELFQELDEKGLTGISPYILEGLDDEDEILFWVNTLIKDRLQHLSLYAQARNKPLPENIVATDLDNLRAVFERLFQEVNRILS